MTFIVLAESADFSDCEIQHALMFQVMEFGLAVKVNLYCSWGRRQHD